MTIPQPKPGARQKLQQIVKVAHAARAGGPVSAIVGHNLQCSPMAIEALASCALTMLDALEFYQDPNNWVIPAGNGDAADYLSATCRVQRDCGLHANEAIKAVNDKLSEG